MAAAWRKNILLSRLANYSSALPCLQSYSPLRYLHLPRAQAYCGCVQVIVVLKVGFVWLQVRDTALEAELVDVDFDEYSISTVNRKRKGEDLHP